MFAKEAIAKMIITALLKRLDSEDFRKWLKLGIDMAREKILATPNKWDDRVGLPLLDLAEEAFRLDDD